MTRSAVRYVIDLRRTADNRVEGLLRRGGAVHAMPFSGWMELLSLLEPPPLDPAAEPLPDDREEWPLPGLL
ncbi:MAG TPA: hypothetical protein VGL20_21080 [Candidatus Dormibacteraeota bacterium]|jgi:hypothetical protein